MTAKYYAAKSGKVFFLNKDREVGEGARQFVR